MTAGISADEHSDQSHDVPDSPLPEMPRGASIRRSVRASVVIGGTLILVSFIFLSARAGNLWKDLEDRTARVRALSSEIERKRQEIARLEEERRHKEDHLKALDSRIAVSARDAERLSDAIIAADISDPTITGPLNDLQRHLGASSKPRVRPALGVLSESDLASVAKRDARAAEVIFEQILANGEQTQALNALASGLVGRAAEEGLSNADRLNSLRLAIRVADEAVKQLNDVNAHAWRGRARRELANLLSRDEADGLRREALADLDVALKGTSDFEIYREAVKLARQVFIVPQDLADFACSAERIGTFMHRSNQCASLLFDLAEKSRGAESKRWSCAGLKFVQIDAFKISDKRKKFEKRVASHKHRCDMP